MAKATKNYLVAHVLEAENCKFNCRPDGINIYSTTVVFYREGTVIARCYYELGITIICTSKSLSLQQK